MSKSRIEELEQQLIALKKINKVLMEKNEDIQNVKSKSSFALFEKNTYLNDLVSVRTLQLQNSNTKLKGILSSLPGITLLIDNNFATLESHFGINSKDIDENLVVWRNFFESDSFRNLIKIKTEEINELGYVVFNHGFEINSELSHFQFILSCSERGYVIYIRDITSEVKLTELIREKEESVMLSSRLASLGEMAGGIAHEINNPLMIISSSIQLVEKLLSNIKIEDVVKTEKVKSKLDLSRSMVFKISKIVQSMKNLSRISSEEDHETFVLSELVEDVLVLCREKCLHNSIDLQIDQTIVDSCHCSIMGSRVEVSQILINLLNNSIDAILNQDNAWIKIFANTTASGDVAIIVSDSGKGIANQILDKIFNPFFTTKDVGKGTGLGLSLSKKLAEKNGGSLDYDRYHENTCFTLNLKVSNSSEHESA